MAVAKKGSPPLKKKASFIQKILLTFLCLSFLGWLILQGTAAIVWGTQDYDAARVFVEHLDIMQSKMAEGLKGISIFNFSIPISADVRKTTTALSTEAKELGRSIGNKASQGLQEFLNEHELQATMPIGSFQEMRTFGLQVLALSKASGHVLLLKLAILATALPLFLLSTLAGLVDGLSQRAIRTASLGRESTYVFHKSVPLFKKTVFLVLALWLALPIPIPPSPIFVSLSVLMGVVISMSAMRFKKYL
jgi:integrating conjugative element membrane protein (TIGR03747 family)